MILNIWNKWHIYMQIVNIRLLCKEQVTIREESVSNRKNYKLRTTEILITI